MSPHTVFGKVARTKRVLSGIYWEKKRCSCSHHALLWAAWVGALCLAPGMRSRRQVTWSPKKCCGGRWCLQAIRSRCTLWPGKMAHELGLSNSFHMATKIKCRRGQLNNCRDHFTGAFQAEHGGPGHWLSWKQGSRL